MSLCRVSLRLASHPRLLASSCARSKSRPLASSRRCAAVPRPSSQLNGRAMSAGSGDYVKMVTDKNTANAVTVYSKTYCPYCSEVKSLFERLSVAAKVLELDEIADGSQVQEALAQITGRRTVPQVFIGGQHIGGCDDTLAAYQSGKLKALLDQAGVQAKL